MKERFTDAEWKTLERLPVLVFVQVGIADGSLEEEESAKFVIEMLDAPNWRDPLIRELFLAMAATTEFAETFEASMRLTAEGPGKVLAELDAGKTILRNKLTEEEYQRFAFSLMGFARRIGEAHVEEQKKKGIFHRKPKKDAPATSDAEAQVIGLLGAVFGLDPAAAAKGFEALRTDGDSRPRV